MHIRYLDAGYAFVIYLGLLVLLARQVESDASRTPAGLSRVSRWSFIAQAGADAISFVGVCLKALACCLGSFIFYNCTAFDVRDIF